MKLINGIDLENMAEPQEANLACRFYSKGLPSVDQIKKLITHLYKKEE